MRTFHWFGRLASLTGVAILLAACASGVGSSPAASMETASATRSAPMQFTLTSTCEATSEAPADIPKPHPDAVWGACEQTASDPRLSGRWEGYSVFQGDPQADWEMSSTGTVENDNGTWACQDFGTARKRLAVIDGVCVGQGGYEGLTAYSHTVSDDATATGGSFGWIIESQ
jgi:hypothetical protein